MTPSAMVTDFASIMAKTQPRVLPLEGEIDLHVSPQIGASLANLIAAKPSKVVVDLSSVGYVDSATIGCLMDLYRQANAAGGALKLAGVQKRVETMLTMTGAQNFIEVHPDEPSAVKSFGA